MGDVGSGYLGYVLVVLALGASRGNPTALAVWVILGGVFFCDAFVTLMRRLARGERVYQAHRSHAYQYLARCWGNHRSVTLAVVCVNLLWLLPCAWWAAARPGIAGWIVLVAFLPLVLVVLVAGAGRRADTE
jgi:Fuc2NAc and GlcNAc transferase